LLDGGPTKNNRDLHKITTVIKGGKVYDPAAIEKALGIAPRHTNRRRALSKDVTWYFGIA
jgi:hypothetical protein